MKYEYDDTYEITYEDKNKLMENVIMKHERKLDKMYNNLEKSKKQSNFRLINKYIVDNKYIALILGISLLIISMLIAKDFKSSIYPAINIVLLFILLPCSAYLLEFSISKKVK